MNRLQKKDIRHLLFLSIWTLLSLTLLSCGGGAGDNENITTITGRFVDDPVQGLDYSCSSGTTGVTNSQGEYVCNAGDTVTFSLGSVIIGNVLARQSAITPYSLFPRNIEAAINLAQLLQSLDSGEDPSYISLDTALVNLLPVALDFESPTFDTDVTDVGITLVSETDAFSQLRDAIINLGNHVPVVDAGQDQTVETGATVNLDGSGSTDEDGDSLSYVWSKLSAPAGSTASLQNAFTDAANFIADVAGVYVFNLMVSDGFITVLDSVTITASDPVLSQNADLLTLVLSGTAISPDFAAGTISYQALVTNAVETVTITPTAADAGATISIFGLPVTSGSAYTSNTLGIGDNDFPFSVTAADGVTSKTYTLTVKRQASPNANLSALVLAGSAISPDFSASTISYEATVANAVETVNITPTAADAGATISIFGFPVTSGSAYTSNTLGVGDNDFPFTVTAADGVSTNTYTLKVIREAASSNADLSALVLAGSAISPNFAAGSISYQATVANAVETVNITPTAADAGATISIFGFPVTSGSAYTSNTLGVGDNNFPFTVTAADGVTSKTYTLTVKREAVSSNANLSNLVLAGSAISPAFDAGTISYTAIVANAVETVTMTLTTADVGATISLSGLPVTSGSPYTPIGSLAVGLNQFDFRVTAADGTTIKTYTLTVTREALSSNADLSALVLSETTFSEVFDPVTINYSATVAYAIESVTVTATVADNDATIKHLGFTISSGNPYTLPILGATLQVGTNDFPLTVTAADGTTTKTYTLTVTRQAAAPANGWTHPVDELSYINPDGAGGTMVTAMNNNGQAIAAWRATDASTDCGASGGDACFQVFISQYQDGSWTTPTDLSDNISPDGFHAYPPQVAISDNGDAVVVWQMNTSWTSPCGSVTFQCSHIYMSEYRNGSWTHPTDINDYIDPANTNNVSQTPKVAMDRSGNTIIVWRNFAGGVYKSEYRNGSWVHPQNISDDIPLSYWNPPLARDDNGNALIVWQGVDSVYNNRLYLSEYRNGVWTHAANLDTDAINPAGQACPGITCSIPVRIAMDNNDNAIIVWDQRTTSYSEYADGSIYKSEYRNGAWTHPVDLDDKVSLGSDLDWARYPEVAMDDNGNALIIWSQNDETLDCDVPFGINSTIPGPCKQLFMSEYRDGSWTFPLSMSDHISPTGQPVTTISGYQTYSVAMGNTGESVIAWSQSIPSATCGGTPDRQIFISEYRDGGWSHPSDLNDYLIDLNIFSYLPLATMDNSGNIFLGWNSLASNMFFSEYHCEGCVTALPEIIAPRNLQATAADGRVDLSWKAVSNAHYYNIYWSTSGVATTSDNQITSISGTSYQHTTLTNKTDYSYLVTAVVSSTESLPSNLVTARPSACVGCEPALTSTILSGSITQDEGKGITVDSTGNVFITGYTWGDMDGNTSNGSSDIFISKYSAGVRQWTVQPGTTGYEVGNDIALDADGNIYVVGQGFLLSKYNSVGALQWSIPQDYPSVSGNGIDLDAAGNIYITGSTTIGLDGNTSLGEADIFISKYNATGTWQWTVQPGTTGNDTGNAIAVDSTGNAYVTGSTLVSGNYIGNSFITKYSTDGDLLWFEEFDYPVGSQYMDKANGIALDADDNAYITGHTNYWLFKAYSISGFEVYVAKYNTDGCLQWTAQRGVSGSFDYGYGIAVDGDANVFVTGQTQGALDGNSFAGEKDIFIMKFDTKGIHGWTKQYGAAGIDYGNAIAVDASGNIFTTGATDGNLNGEVNNNGDESLYVYDVFMMTHTGQD